MTKISNWPRFCKWQEESGNIRHIVAHNKQLSTTKGYVYKYDQLHRLRIARMWDYTDSGTYSWTSTGSPSNKYLTAYQYDPNGNLTNLLRYDDSPSIIDNLGYAYYPGTNQLSKVADGHSGPEGVPSGQYTNNYQYDENGNLIIDLLNDVGVEWTGFGKVRNAYRTSPIYSNFIFFYGPDQNRWSKAYNLAGESTYTQYVRDAQGNVLSTYEYYLNITYSEKFNFSWKECYIYGSSRIGVLNPGITYQGSSIYEPGPAYTNFPDSAIFAGDSVSLYLCGKRYGTSPWQCDRHCQRPEKTNRY